jgi:hypothetical protein
MKLRFSLCFLSLLLIVFSSCAPTEPPIGEQENYVTVSGADMTFSDHISPADLAPSSAEGAWLAGCASPDRDNFFDAFALRHESTTDGNTTFTYLIYYPHEGVSMNVTAALLQDGEDYVICLSYTKGKSQDASLSYVSVTLPTDVAPELSLIFDGDELGILSTVTQSPITRP